jgi:8-oxo-dGTP pyrophosphatase MutT (NUDIX family)
MKKVIPKNAVLIPDHAERVFEGKIFDVYQWQQQMFDGSTMTFEMLKRPDTVEIVAIKDNKLVVLEETQPNLPAHYTIPAGRNDFPGESPLDGAKRELLEEAGLTCKTWKLLKVVQPHAKFEWFVYVFLATDVEKEEPHQPEEYGEKISIMYKTLDEVKAMLDDPKNRYLQKELFQNLTSFDDLLQLPEFEGQEVDR